jgi:outer membrane protein TolC
MKKNTLFLLLPMLLLQAGLGALAGTFDVSIPTRTAQAAAQESAGRMTLEACLLRALQSNLDLRITILEPQKADAAVTQAGEAFLPVLSFDTGKQSNRSASFSFFDGTDNIVSRYDDYQANLSQRIPTGGTLTASLSSYKSETNSNYQTINPRYGSQLSFSFRQPLLRDFGYRIPRREILIAQQDRERSEYAAKRAVLDTLFNVESAYWDLVYAIEDLKVRRQSVQLARDLLERNRTESAIGMLAPIEVLTAEAEAASREAEIHQAEALVKSREDALRNLLDLRTPAGEMPAPIVPADTPASDARATVLESALASALANRPELLSARTSVRSRDLDLVYARNQLLPDLSLNLSYWSPGISGTQILYQDDNPLTGVVVGRIAGLASAAMKDATDFKYRNWALGLTLTVPLNTILTRAAAARAGLDVEQARLQLERTEQAIILEVRNALRDVETNLRRVASYEAARRLAEKRLDGEDRKVKVGLSTNYTLLQVQRDLTSARSLELKARIDYAVSLAKLDQVQGTSLESRNIAWTSPLKK